MTWRVFRPRMWFMPLLALLGALGWPSGSNMAADAVRVRAWEHTNFARLVFDWPQPVQFTASVKDGRLKARFDREFSADFGVAVRRLSAYVRTVRLAPDKRGAEFELTGDYRLSAFYANRSVVFDLLPHRQVRTTSAGTATPLVPDRVRTADRAAAPVVGVRLGKHSTYTRLVFDWSETVDYSVQQRADSVTIQFGRNARIDVAPLRRKSPAGFGNPVAKTVAKGVDVSFTKAPDTQVRHFRLGTKVVVDFVHGAGAAPSGKATAKMPSQAKKAPEQTGSKPSSVSSNPPQAVVEPDEPPPPQAAPRAAVEAEWLPIPEKPGPETAAPSVSLSAPGSAPAEMMTADLPQAPASGSDADSVQASPGDAAEKNKQSDAGETKEASVAQQEAVAEDADDADGAQVSLVFEWPEPVGAAVFVRKPYVWIVFDQRAQLNLAALRDAGKGLISQIEQLPLGTGTIIRLRPNPGVNPHVEQEAFNWIVSFRKWPVEAKIPIAFQVRPDAIEGAELEFPVSEFGQVVHVPDPEVGDMLKVVTLRAPGHGIPGHHRYPEFEILPSAQGLAIDPLSDDLDIKQAGKRGLVLVTPGGLHVSAVSQNEGESGSFLGPRVFNFANWMRRDDGSFIEARRAALRAVVEVPPERRDDARLDLARFYFAHGFAPEALGVLRTIQFSNEAMASQPEFRAMVGAALVHMGRSQEARKDLLDPRLDEFQEIALWRGSMFLQAGDIKKAAAQFRTGDPVLQSYPEPMRTKLALERVEASLAALDVGNASIWLNYLAKLKDRMPRRAQARMLYNQGLLARDSRDLDRAVELWTAVKKTGDRWNVTRSELALIELGLQQETISDKEAMERLDRLRFQWRGDRLELAILQRLGELYLAKEEYRKGLNVLRTAVTYFPNEEKVKDIAHRMTSSFKTLHLEGGADTMPPLKALALYDDFRELTPAGQQGDRMIQRLADRLVSVDLLDRAADLLAHQVRYRLKGEEKARVGAKLAVIQLLDRQPKKALSALRSSFHPNLPQTLEDDRRRIRAKATLELSRYEEAIALLAGDVSSEADLLRASIYWSTQNYTEAAKVLQRLSGDPLAEGGYDEERANYILSWAVALRLKRDVPGLKMVRELYGTGMEQSPLGDSFAFIASPSGNDAKNVDAIARKLAEADKFEAFLKNYRQRLTAPLKGSAAPGGLSTEAKAIGKNDVVPQPAAPAQPTKEATPNETAAPSDIPPPPPPPQG